MSDLRSRAIHIYDQFTHEHRDRRTLLREMALLAGSTVAAEALIASIAASPAAAQIVPADDARLRTHKGPFDIGGGRTMTGYAASPIDPPNKLGVVMVIHENRGLTRHIEDVARRVALEGFYAIAPDFLSAQGGTPADEDKAREMIGKLDYDATVAAAVATLDRASKVKEANGKAGTVGFCWGGALVNRIAVAAGPALAAGVSYYGPAPDPAEAARVQAPLMLQLAGNDARVNATALPWGEALKAAGRISETNVYPNVEHAFNNDTSPERYNAAAAKLAWDRTIAFFHRHLDG